MNNKVKAFILSIVLVHIIGGGYIYIKNLGKKRTVYMEPPIDAWVELSSSKIDVTDDISNESNIHKTTLIATVTNNTLETLTDVRLIILADIGTLESPITKRYIHVPQKYNDTVFSLGNIASGKSKEAIVWLYSTQKKLYTIQADIDTNERFTAKTNALSLEAD